MLSNKMLETNRPPLRSMLSTDSDVPSTVNLALLAAGAQLCVRAMLNTNATKEECQNCELPRPQERARFCRKQSCKNSKPAYAVRFTAQAITITKPRAGFIMP